MPAEAGSCGFATAPGATSYRPALPPVPRTGRRFTKGVAAQPRPSAGPGRWAVAVVHSWWGPSVMPAADTPDRGEFVGRFAGALVADFAGEVAAEAADEVLGAALGVCNISSPAVPLRWAAGCPSTRTAASSARRTSTA